jgi:hypothetical protein
MRAGWLETFLGYILQQDLDSMYNTPNVTTLFTVCTALMSQHELIAAFPPSERCLGMMLHKKILGKMMEEQIPTKKLDIKLNSMCKGNF